jgi:hypothetical protein
MNFEQVFQPDSEESPPSYPWEEENASILQSIQLLLKSWIFQIAVRI